jgi:hypothetical protein
MLISRIVLADGHTCFDMDEMLSRWRHYPLSMHTPAECELNAPSDKCPQSDVSPGSHRHDEYRDF